MSDQLDPKLLDKRTCERHLRTGRLDEKLWEKHLKGLADAAEKAAPVKATMGDLDEDDDVVDDEG